LISVIVMWRWIKDLPMEIGGIHVFAFLCVKDIVQMERAVVTASERDALFCIVRSGLALDLRMTLSDDAMHTWLCKNNIKIKTFVLTAQAEKNRPDLYICIDTAQLIHVNESVPEFPADPRLCDKVNNMFMGGIVSFTDIEPTPGQRFHHLHQLFTMADNFQCPWVPELLLANPGLHALQISLRCDKISSAWFGDAARLCRSLQELDVYGLRGVTDDGALRSIAAHCTSLRKLTLRGRGAAAESAFGEEPIVAITLKCKLLETVWVDACSLTAPTVTAICKNCRNLTSLHLPCEGLSATDLLHLLPQHRKRPITELECRWALQQESEVQACAALFSGLRTLRVTVPAQCERAFVACCHILHEIHSLCIKLACGLLAGAGEDLRAVAQTCHQLRYFTYIAETADIDAVITIIARNHHLLGYTNECWEGSDRILQALAQHCPLLESATVANVSDSAVIALALGCKHLRDVRFKSAGITDAGLMAISSCRELQAISIQHCVEVTEAGLTSLVAACSQQLFCLNVKHPVIDYAAAERIRSSRDPAKFFVSL
jgi:hypothetical protein